MFMLEITTGMKTGSTALPADALDFLEDAANYAPSLRVLDMSLVARAKTALFKGRSIMVLSLWALSNTAWHAVSGGVPGVVTMGFGASSSRMVARREASKHRAYPCNFSSLN
jgi:hypothetical protein